MIDKDLVGCSITTAHPHHLDVGDYIVMNGKSYRVSSIQEVTTFTARNLNWYERLYLFWLGFLHGLSAPARICSRWWGRTVDWLGRSER